MDDDFVRAVAGVRLAHLVCECARGAAKIVRGLAIVGRRSPHSLYDSRLANQQNLELFDNKWAQGFTSLWTLPSRLAAQQQQ